MVNVLDRRRSAIAAVDIAKHRMGSEIIPVVGSELGRGRGGPRFMTCPIVREP